MAAYSQATLVQRVRYLLNDTPAVDSLTGSYTAGGLTLTVADATLYDKGDLLEFKTDGDTFLVDSASGTTVTMIAAGLGWDGATNANHASGAVFYVKPAFRYLQIIEHIDDTIMELWPYCWKSVTDTITPVSGQYYYDAATSATNAIDIIDAKQRDTAGGSSYRMIDYGLRRSIYGIELQKGLPTGVAASTVGYYFPRMHNFTNSVVVRVRARITNTVAGGLYSDLDVTNAAGVEIIDSIVLGAAARLLEGSEFPRDTQEDVTMGDASVGPQSRLRSAAYFRRRFEKAREAARVVLMQTIPPQPPQWTSRRPSRGYN